MIGLTIVAFGTSAPELAVTAGAVMGRDPALAVGNVVGSNIFNVLVILGASAVLAPLVVTVRLIRFDVPLMIGASALATALALDRHLGPGDGAILLGGIAAYTAHLLVTGREVSSDRLGTKARTGSDRRLPVWVVASGLLAVGLGLLTLGARWFVGAAADIAVALGVDELVVGLTVVAARTSLPELATSVLASLRGQREIAVGNVVGSNIFNLLAVLGIGAALADEGIPVPTGALTFDFPVVVAVAIATLPIFFTGFRISRWEGALFLGYYATYLVFLLLQATRHHAADELGAAVMYFAIPLTALTLLVLVVRALRDPAARLRDGKKNA